MRKCIQAGGNFLTWRRLSSISKAVTPLAELSKNTRLCAAGLFLLTVMLFYPASGFQFLTYDDSAYVVHNKYVKQGLNEVTVRWAFTGPHHSMWHPLTSLSHLLDVEMFGLSPQAHHTVNILIHGVNAVVLYLWLLVVFRLPLRALIVAAIFAWHPLRVESVAWVAERKDVLCTLCWLLTLHAYTRYVRKPGKASYLLTLGSFALAVMAKPMSVTLPAVLLLLDGWPFKRLGAGFSAEGNALPIDRKLIFQRIVEKIPFFCLSLFLAVITVKAQQEGEVLKMMTDTTLADRVGNALVSYVRYLGLLLWPVNLAVLYPHPGRWPVGVEVAALAVLGGVSYLCWRFRRSQPWWLVAWIWFLITLLPVSGLIQAGGAALANRYSYISTIGLICAAVWTLAEWAAKQPETRRKPAGVTVFAVLMSCVVLTLAALPFWRDTETLFREALRVAKANSVAYMVLGEALLDKGKPEAAMVEVSHGIMQFPEDGRLHLLVGRILLELNRPDQALEALSNAAKFNAKLDEVDFHMARSLRRMGRAEEARALLVRYLEKQPDNSSAWNNLGGIQAEQRDIAGAEKSFRNALATDAALVEARKNLVRLLAVGGRSQEALKELQAGLKFAPDNADLWFQNGLLQEEAGDLARARGSFEMAAKLKPNWSLPKESLIWLLIQQPQISTKDARLSVMLLSELLNHYGAEVPLRVAELQACTAAANGRFDEAVEMAGKVRGAFQKNGDQQGVARVESQITAFRAKQRWLPGK
ncbi:MAG TPA: tetratricopeptide repeat protein [Verrucomicrobiae bacterium]